MRVELKDLPSNPIYTDQTKDLSVTKKLLGKMNGELSWFGYYDIRYLTLFVYKFSAVGQFFPIHFLRSSVVFFPVKLTIFHLL